MTMAGAESSDTPWLSLFLKVAYDPYSGYMNLGALYFKKRMKLPLLPVL